MNKLFNVSEIDYVIDQLEDTQHGKCDCCNGALFNDVREVTVEAHATAVRIELCNDHYYAMHEHLGNC